MHTFLVILDTNDPQQALSAKQLTQSVLASFDADTGPVCGPDGQPVNSEKPAWHSIPLRNLTNWQKDDLAISEPASRSAARPVNADGHNIAKVAFFGMSAWALIAAGLIAYLY